jgi:3-hydroxyisobutyrate dehydrogenase
MKKIGWIGTGVMGNAMVQHLIKAGYEVNVYNRTKSKTDNLVDIGATFINNVGDLAASSDIIISIIGDPKNVEDTYFGRNGIIENARQGSILVDMTTTKPSLAKRIYESANKKWLSSLDAPVSGWDVWAIWGTLSIMVGGDMDDFTSLATIFGLMGKTITYTGGAGTGQHTKMANQISIAGNTIALCESLVYAEKSGLNLQKTIEVVSGWAAGNWGWNNLAPRIIKGELDTCFFVKHFVKDMKIALEECKNMGIELPWLSLVNSLYQNLIEHEEENLWTQALIKVIKRMNNMKLDS